MKSLKDVYAPYFKIGAAVNRRTIKSHRDLILSHFNSMTCENEMKYGSLCDEKGNYDTSGADEIYEFAVINDLGLRGHTLVWHNQTPQYVFAENDSGLLLDRLANHMQFVSERYQKNTYEWDVVNEAIDDKTEAYLRDSKWLEILGDDFIVKVFKLAGKYFPDKKLFYNDYNETNPVKRVKIARLVKELQDKGAPIHGIGFQAHYNIFEPNLDEIREAYEFYASLGLKISVTEMDISVFKFEDHSSIPEPTADLIEKHAELYRQCFKLFREYSEIIESVTLWGVADDATWLDHFPARNRKNWPLLFDTNHQPKEAFHRVVDF